MKYKQPGDMFNEFQEKKRKASIRKMYKKEPEKGETKKHEAGESKAFEAKERDKKRKKNWIAGAIKHPGALRRTLGVKGGKKIPAGKLAAAAKKGGVTGKRARLAETLKSFHKTKKKAIKQKSGKNC